MLPDEVYKRRHRHNNTPSSILLIIVNYIVMAVSTQVFVACNKVNWFYWVVVGLLAAYNIYDIRKNREEYDRIKVIAYTISVAGLFLLFFLIRSQSRNC